MLPNRPSHRLKKIAAAITVLITLAAFPMASWANHQFGDVSNAHPFHYDIDALVDSGVTSGCGGGLYCPDSLVTRGQMAAFLNRLGALAPDKPPVANATTVDRFNANQLNRVAFNSTENMSSNSLTTTITADGSGYLLIWGHVQGYLTTTSGTPNIVCQLEVDDAYVGGTYSSADLQYVASPVVDHDDDDCNTSGGVSVCPGTFTVELAVTPGTNVDAVQATIMAEFVPFGGNGNPPLCLIAPSVEAPTGGDKK